MLVSELDALQANLNRALDTVRSELKAAELPEYSHSPLRHPLDNPDVLTPPRLYEARRLALACVVCQSFPSLCQCNAEHWTIYPQGQLKYLLQVPYEKAVEQSCAVYDTACLDIFVKTGIVDLLGEPAHLVNGLHVHELHEKLDLSSQRLAAILRYLSTQGWVHERELDVFSLSRPALELLPGRNGRNWVMTTGKPKIAASLFDFMTHPQWKYSTSSNQTAFQLAYNTDDTVFAYLKKDPSELAQWASSVRSMGDTYEAALLTDYPWMSLDSRLIIDVGGGQGGLVLSLARILPKCKFLIQDLEEVIPLARGNVECSLPDALEDGHIQVQAHDFFQRQPKVTQDTVYILRYILHNWSDEDCIKILRNIQSVARPESKILVIETVVVPAIVSKGSAIDENGSVQCSSAPGAETNRTSYKSTTTPEFVPANFGMSSKMPLALGIHLMSAFNAYERTLPEFESIIHSSGLKINRVNSLRAHTSVIECTLGMETSSNLVVKS